MSFGPVKVYSVTIASATTFSSAITMGRAYASAYLEVPTMASGSQIFLQGSVDGSTFRRVSHPPPNSTTASATDWAIASTVTQKMVPIPVQFPYLRIELGTATTSAGGTAYGFNIICADT